MQELTESIDAVQKRQAQVLPILQYPNPLLSKISAPIIADIQTDKNLQALLDDMVRTMQYCKAVGLAAVQVGHTIRALVVQDANGEAIKVINPRLVEVSEEQERSSEGCLSFMGLFIQVRRPKECVVEFFDETGAKRTTIQDGLLGRAIQHEIDHLDGKTFLDRVSRIERQAILNKNKNVKRKFKQTIKALANK